MKVLNSKGQPIVLNAREQLLADRNQRICNALGYEISITTLTTIMKKVSEQKFFTVPGGPAEYIPFKVGEGAWSTNLVTYRSFDVADDFSTGVVNVGGDNMRMAGADAGVDSVTVAVKNWNKTIGWSIMDLEMAAKAGNWDLVTAKEKARKKNWDLGIQKIAFLGLAGDSSVLGLLNQAGVTYNTTRITSPISSLSPVDLKGFITGILNDYRSNCNRTAMPSHFILPESDFLGLAGPASADFPIKSTLAVMLETFQVMTGNSKFKILPLAYADAQYSGFGFQQYVLLNYEEESIRMNIPVDYTNTLANSVNNFQFQNVGYGQFSGVQALRPAEVLYFKY